MVCVIGKILSSREYHNLSRDTWWENTKLFVTVGRLIVKRYSSTKMNLNVTRTLFVRMQISEQQIKKFLLLFLCIYYLKKKQTQT